MTSTIQEIRVYLARLGLLLNPLKSKVMGYVHTYVDEFGNLVDPETNPKIDPAGNNYFDEDGMPKGHASTSFMIDTILDFHKHHNIQLPKCIVMDTDNCAAQFKSAVAMLSMAQSGEEAPG